MAMRLIEFQVTNFRSVEDSGWIEADRVTALIGVNESGKTNLLLPLWKLNPARDGEIRPTSDYPKGNFTAVRENPSAFRFIAARFDTADIVQRLGDLTGVATKWLDVVQVSRAFDSQHAIEFPHYKPSREVESSTVSALVDSAMHEVEQMAPLEGEESFKNALVEALRTIDGDLKTHIQLSAEQLSNIKDKIQALVPAKPHTNSSIVPRLRRLLNSTDGLQSQLNLLEPDQAEGVEELVLSHLPRFVYYSNYGNLDSEIYLPHVVQNLKRIEELGAREAAKARTLKVLFSFVRLQPEEILELGRDFQEPGKKPTSEQISQIAEKKRERTILLNSADTDLTKKFREWWKQGDYTFQFQADGDHFRIWVSDSRRPEKVELEDRSSGLQWFFSFYLIFLVESGEAHDDAILLLDEPGLSLHPLAQRDLSQFFEGLANTNQILYTTHSPFLVDADRLDRARKVFVAEDGSTKASPDLRRGSDNPRKEGATYAIYSALNMNVAESILYGCYPVIVEGPSDQHYLAMIKTLLISGQKIAPRRELVFPPSHGAKNAKVVASILTGMDETLPFMLLDSDDAGNKMATDMRNGLYKSAKDRVLQTDAYAAFAKSEIEDLVPPELIADAMGRVGRAAEIPFSDGFRIGEPIVPQIDAWAKQQKLQLDDGWKVDLARTVKARALARGIASIDSTFVDRWTKLFADLRAAS